MPQACFCVMLRMVMMALILLWQCLLGMHSGVHCISMMRLELQCIPQLRLQFLAFGSLIRSCARSYAFRDVRLIYVAALCVCSWLLVVFPTGVVDACIELLQCCNMVRAREYGSGQLGEFLLSHCGILLTLSSLESDRGWDCCL